MHCAWPLDTAVSSEPEPSWVYKVSVVVHTIPGKLALPLPGSSSWYVGE